MIDLPSSPEDMQLLLLTYREELITAKVAKVGRNYGAALRTGLTKSTLALQREPSWCKENKSCIFQEKRLNTVKVVEIS